MQSNYLLPPSPSTPRPQRSEDAGCPPFTRHRHATSHIDHDTNFRLSPFSRRGLAASPSPCHVTNPPVSSSPTTRIGGHT